MSLRDFLDKDTDSLTFQIGERNTDMIQTAQINATTANLGGGEQIISKVKAGESAKLSNVEGGTLEVTGKSAAVNVTLSGNLGKLTADTGALVLTVDPEDTNLMAKLKDISTLTQGTGASKNQFTLAAAATADLRAIDFDSVKLTNATATNAKFSVTETSGFNIKNNELGSTNDLTITAKQDIKKGEILTEENIRSVRPGYGMHPKYLKDVLGKIAERDYEFGERLNTIF